MSENNGITAAAEAVEEQLQEEIPEVASQENEEASEPVEKVARDLTDLTAAIETLVFVSEEPLTTKMLSDILDEDRRIIQSALESLSGEYDSREGGLQLREIAGGWQLSTRPQYHEDIRRFLRTRPSAKLSIASLETLAVIAYKQPVTVPEIMEIRAVQSPSAIKTLLDKRLIVAKGRKETVGRPMMYGTSKDFLIQFGLKDLSELPSIEDFEDLVS
jgi:segregation and condensation protein B